MNRDQFAGKWHELKGKVKETWGKLTDDDIEQINGKLEQLSGKLQKRYGWAKDHVEREINNLCASCEHGNRGEHQHGWNQNEGMHGKKHPGQDDFRDKKRKAG